MIKIRTLKETVINGYLAPKGMILDVSHLKALRMEMDGEAEILDVAENRTEK